MKSYVFGPVPSRRLGRSLGLDLVPFKTCTYDCIYCQLGRTTCKTLTRKPWVPIGAVLSQLRERLETKPDYITLSGSGEPTLHSRVGEIISGIKEMTDTPVAVLTNGSLLWSREVALSLKMADLVVPSLDAGDEKLFQYVNRPHGRLTLEKVLQGLIEFREVYEGALWLEVFLLGGVTAVPAEVEKIARLVDRIRPDRVQVNSVTRPPAEDFALPVSEDELERLSRLLGDKAEVIADYRGTHARQEFRVRRNDVEDLLTRRPCTIEDIANGLGLHRNEVVKHVQELVTEGRITQDQRPSGLYYKAAQNAR